MPAQGRTPTRRSNTAGLQLGSPSQLGDGEVVDRCLAVWVDPEVVFAQLYSSRSRSFWLDAGDNAGEGCSYIGAPVTGAVVAIEDSARSVVRIDGDDAPFEGSMFDFLRERDDSTKTGSSSPSGFQLGWVGWFGYECGTDREGTAAVPRAAMMQITRLIVFEHGRREVILRGLSSAAGLADWFTLTAAHLRQMAEEAPPVAGEEILSELDASFRHSRSEYLGLIEKCQDAIHRGDAYQLCLTNQIEVIGERDPFATYRRLRSANSSHHGGFLRFDDVCLLSSSPEQFLDITPAGLIRTRPIKGTRPRGTNEAEDQRLRGELDASEKERAENVMIVDLMRNDLGRIAVVGSVAVPELFSIEQYANVFQLVSTVTAQLAPPFGPLDAIRAAFPAGSMTGAPKISAMHLLEGLEAGPRGIYAGAFGYLGSDGRVDLAMTIRSIVMTPGRATIGTGGGITALSIPDAEFEEIVVKAAPLLAALGAELGTA
jgi:para-aminobenzoate synthetase component I